MSLECVQLLLSRDAPVKLKNGLGWTVLAEAVSYGHRPTSKIFLMQFSANFNYLSVLLVSSLVRKFKQQSRDQMEKRRPHLVQALKQIGDFYMELKWDFHSWGKYTFHFNNNYYIHS